MTELAPKLPPLEDELSKPTVYEGIMTLGADAGLPKRSRDQFMDDLISYGWPSIGRGIVLAGACYPAVVAAVYLVIGAVYTVIGQFGSAFPTDKVVVFGFLMGSLVFAAIFGAIGVIWSGIVAILTLPVVHAVVWSMKLRPNLVWLGAFSGGLVAFVAIVPGAMQIPRLLETGQAWAGVIMLLVGPALATVVGQIGGALGAKRGNERIAMGRMAPKIELLRLKFALKSPAAHEPDVSVATAEGAKDASRFQFRTIHLLWVGVWVSLLLTLIRLSGIPYELILPLLLGWGAFQALSLLVGKLLFRRFGPWWGGE